MNRIDQSIDLFLFVKITASFLIHNFMFSMMTFDFDIDKLNYKIQSYFLPKIKHFNYLLLVLLLVILLINIMRSYGLTKFDSSFY